MAGGCVLHFPFQERLPPSLAHTWLSKPRHKSSCGVLVSKHFSRKSCLASLQSHFHPAPSQNSTEKWNRKQGKCSAAPNSAGFEELGSCHQCWWNNCVWLLENLLHWKLFQCCGVPNLCLQHRFLLHPHPAVWCMGKTWAGLKSSSQCSMACLWLSGEVLWGDQAARTWRSHRHF